MKNIPYIVLLPDHSLLLHFFEEPASCADVFLNDFLLSDSIQL